MTLLLGPTVIESPATDVTDSDQSLLQRYFVDGDRDAMERLFNRHAGMAYRIALREVRNAADAEEVVQTAFFNILTKGDHQGANVRGWIMRIVVNACRNRATENTRRREREGRASTGHAEEPADTEKAELVSAALRQINGLPERYRLPVSLHFLEGLSFKEISYALSLPEDTVSKQARRGIEQLRQSLAAAGFASVVVPELLSAAPLVNAPAALTASFKTVIASAALKGSVVPFGAAAAKGGVGISIKKAAIGAVLLLTCAAVATSAWVARNGHVNTTAVPATLPKASNSAPNAVPTENLLQNPGFESGEANWIPYMHAGEVGSHSVVSTPSHSGTNSLQITFDGSELGLQQDVEVTGGVSYLSSAWIKARATNDRAGGRMEVGWRTKQGDLIKWVNVGGSRGTNVDWTRISKVLSAPATAEKATILIHVAKLANASGTVWIDDVELSRIDK
jgi:RNA polymerase sigma factor (sigma-70 family)